MGTDKALLPVDGVPMAQRVAQALRLSGATPVIAVGGDARQLEAAGLTVVPDTWPGAGPLGGILTALDTVDASVVVVIACDLVDPSADTVRALVDTVLAHDAVDVAVPLLDGRRRLDQLALRRSRSRGRIEAAFQNGARSIRAGLEGLEVREVEGLDAQTLLDADTPSDLPLR